MTADEFSEAMAMLEELFGVPVTDSHVKLFSEVWMGRDFDVVEEAIQGFFNGGWATPYLKKRTLPSPSEFEVLIRNINRREPPPKKSESIPEEWIKPNQIFVTILRGIVATRLKQPGFKNWDRKVGMQNGNRSRSSWVTVICRAWEKYPHPSFTKEQYVEMICEIDEELGKMVSKKLMEVQ